MVALSILPLRQRIGRVVARSTRATTVTSSPSTRLDRSVSLPGSKYRRGTKSSRSPTVWRLRYFARGLAVGLPTTWPSGVDRSATSLHPQQQRLGRLTTVDEADLDVVATLSRRGGDHGRELRRCAGAADHRQQLATAGEQPGNHIRSDHGKIVADGDDVAADHAQHVARVTPAGARLRLLAGHRDRSVSGRRGRPAQGDGVFGGGGGRLEHGGRRKARGGRPRPDEIN